MKSRPPCSEVLQKPSALPLTQKPLTSEEESLLNTKLPYFSSPEYIFKVRESLAQKKNLVLHPEGPGRIDPSLHRHRYEGPGHQPDSDYRRFLCLSQKDDLRSRKPPQEFEGLFLPASKKSSALSWPIGKPKIPGVKEGHLIQAIEEAVRKMDLLPHGFDEEETHHLFPVLKPFGEVKKPEVLLLPYCAKEMECSYRNLQGCDECGRCSVGDASQMARSFGMEPITIQNYEDLESVLCQLKRSGVHGFVGSCCEPFYGKHRPDFERIGLPGILVDVERSTCYDLGQEKKAFKGQFENQTHLNLPLLQRVLEFSHG